MMEGEQDDRSSIEETVEEYIQRNFKGRDGVKYFCDEESVGITWKIKGRKVSMRKLLRNILGEGGGEEYRDCI